MQLDLSGPKVRLDVADPALKLTLAQREAMATDREILVSAGAGAGKTHTSAGACPSRARATSACTT